MRFSGFSTTSGGIKYHLKALLYSKDLWSHYRSHLNTQLKSWPKKNDQLILIGPSAGYSLEKAFLNRYEKIVAIDPDPLSKALFSFRLSVPGQIKKTSSQKTNLLWDFNDYFYLLNSKKREPLCHTKDNKNFYSSLGLGLKKIINHYPHSDILFCNFLGQIPNLLTEKKNLTEEEKQMLYSGRWLKLWRTDINKYLKNKNWASYHDILSTNFSHKKDHRTISLKQIRRSDFSDMTTLARLFLPQNTHENIVFHDHQCFDLFDHKSKARYWAWSLSPKQLHIIEFIHN